MADKDLYFRFAVRGCD